MTYHFTGMDELLREAFTRFADEVAARAEERMAHASDRDEALDAFAANIEQDVFASQRDLVLTLELYTLAARRPEFRDITSAWMGRTRATMAPFLDPTTAVLLDAMNEGLTIHRALHLAVPEPGLASEGVDRLSGRGPAQQES